VRITYYVSDRQVTDCRRSVNGTVTRWKKTRALILIIIINKYMYIVCYFEFRSHEHTTRAFYYIIYILYLCVVVPTYALAINRFIQIIWLFDVYRVREPRDTYPRCMYIGNPLYIAYIHLVITYIVAFLRVYCAQSRTKEKVVKCNVTWTEQLIIRASICIFFYACSN